MLTLVNGEPAEQVSVFDRGLLYGDGCFETLRISNHQVILEQAHFQRLQNTLDALGIKTDMDQVHTELMRLLAMSPGEGVAKILISRGAGGRGYRPGNDDEAGKPSNSTRILQFFDLPKDYLNDTEQGVSVMLCQHRLCQSKELAGLKHLNRMDQVLASREIPEGFAEGLCLDQAGNIVEGTRSNLLLAEGNTLICPDLSRAGVRGVMLGYLLERFQTDGFNIEQQRVTVSDLKSATEAFLCNSVFGVWPVIKFQENATVSQWQIGPLTRQAIHYQNDVFQHCP